MHCLKYFLNEKVLKQFILLTMRYFQTDIPCEDHQHNLDHTDDKFITSFYFLSLWSNGRSADLIFTVFVVSVSNPVLNTPFLQNISYLGNFCISKCLGSEGGKFVLMINTHMVNK